MKNGLKRRPGVARSSERENSRVHLVKLDLATALGDTSVPNVHHPAVLRVPMRMLSAPLTKIVVKRRPATERGLNRES